LGINVLIAVLLSSLTIAQVKVQPMGPGAMQNALFMERKGDLLEAGKIYELMLEDKPNNRQAYTRLKNIYRRLGQFENEVILIRNWLQTSPYDLQQHVELGEILYYSGNQKEAYQVWIQFMDQYGQNSSAYRLLIHTFSRLGLTDKMIEIVYQGREQFKDPSFMALEMGNYFQSRQEIANAVSEYLIYGKHNPKQLKLINKKILIMSDDPENIKLIELELTNYIDKSPNIAHNLLSSFYFKIGQYPLSRDHQLLIHDEYFSRLNRLVRFADNLRKEKQYDLAIGIYQTILNDIHLQQGETNSKLLGKALLGLGEVYEDKIQPHKINHSLILNEVNNLFFTSHLNVNNQISSESLAQALSMYNAVLNDIKITSFSPLAYFRLGEIQFNILENYDGAQSAFEAALNAEPDLGLLFKIHSRLIDILIVKGKFNEATLYLNSLPIAIMNKYPNAIAVKTIQIGLYNGQIDSTLKQLENYLDTMIPSDNHFNDFMELQTMITHFYSDGNQIDKKAFQQYISGETLLAQNKLSEAAEMFSSIRGSYPNGSIIHLATTREIFTWLQLNQYERAISTLNEWMGTDPGDKELVLAGEIYQYIQNDAQTALGYYERLLQHYPQSFLFEPVRQRVRQLKTEIGSG